MTRTEDLRIVTSESFTDEQGARLVCVYDVRLDAVTFVDDLEARTLRDQGVVEIETLPGLSIDAPSSDRAVAGAPQALGVERSPAERELNEVIPVDVVLQATRDFLDSAGWVLEFDERFVDIPRHPEPAIISRAFIKAHAPDVFLGDHYEAAVALAPRLEDGNLIAQAGVLKLYFNRQGELVSEDRYRHR